MDELPPCRRRFLARVVVVLNAFVAMVVATPAVGYLLSPILKRRSSQWVAIGKASQFASHDPRPVAFQYNDEDGYSVGRTHRVAYVRRSDEAIGDEGIIVLSPVCTHMGCNVVFNEATNQFECPCHGGRYNVSGSVVGGPPPRPLARFPTRVRDGNLEIQVS